MNIDWLHIFLQPSYSEIARIVYALTIIRGGSVACSWSSNLDPVITSHNANISRESIFKCFAPYSRFSSGAQTFCGRVLYSREFW